MNDSPTIVQLAIPAVSGVMAPRVFTLHEEISMTDSTKVLFTAKVHTTGGRDGGASQSSDGRLDIKHSIPGTAGTGTNPEQLFAAGWSACFEGAMGIAARKMKITLPAAMAIDAEVDLCLSSDAYFLRGRLSVSLPGLELDLARQLIESGHRTCPYSKATRGNIDVLITLVEPGTAPTVIIDAQVAPEKRL
jgi:lipoyl-dependent peroxiredoxin